MATINPYLNFLGKTEDAFNFYRSVFGGEFIGGVRRFNDYPEGKNLPEADRNKVMHVALPIGKGNILMGTDALESMGHTLVEGTNFSISIGVDSRAEADKIFNTLAVGGDVVMPLADAFWGDYFGMLKDKFGIQWMVSYTFEQKK